MLSPRSVPQLQLLESSGEPQGIQAQLGPEVLTLGVWSPTLGAVAES